VAAAAAQWGVAADRCDLVDGTVVELKGTRRLPIAALIGPASASPCPRRRLARRRLQADRQAHPPHRCGRKVRGATQFGMMRACPA
jgi:hypothetical protein